MPQVEILRLVLAHLLPQYEAPQPYHVFYLQVLECLQALEL